jgi:hypothetical protein
VACGEGAADQIAGLKRPPNGHAPGLYAGLPMTINEARSLPQGTLAEVVSVSLCLSTFYIALHSIAKFLHPEFFPPALRRRRVLSPRSFISFLKVVFSGCRV